MSTLDPPAGWPDIDGIDTTERLLGGPDGALNRAAKGLTARTKQLRVDQSSLEGITAAQAGQIGELDSELATAQDDILALQQGQSSSRISATGWTAGPVPLATLTGAFVGQGATVADSDTGTHIDPVSGASVPNAGDYTWAPQWSWVGASQLPALQNSLAVVQSRIGGSDVEFLYPNEVWDTSFQTVIAQGTNAGATVDGVTFFKGAGATLAAANAPDGRPAVSFGGGGGADTFVAWGVPATAGTRISASVRIVSGTVAGSLSRVLLQQYTAAGTEVTAARQTWALTPGTVSEVFANFTNILVDATAAAVRIRVDTNNAGTAVILTDVLIAAGASARFRPDWRRPVNGLVDLGVTRSVQASAAQSSLSLSNPNLFQASTFDFTTAAPIVAGSPVSVLFGGRHAWRQTYLSGTGTNENALDFGPFPASVFQSGMVSASAELMGADASASGWVRVLLRQFNGATEITAARQVQQLVTTAAVTTSLPAAFAGVALDPACTSVRLYLGVLGATTANRNAYWRNLLVCDGASATWRPPVTAGGSTVRTAYVSPTGSDLNAGTAASPLASVDAAITRINGSGTVFVLPGTYGVSARVTPALVTDHVSVVGIRTNLSAGNFAYPVVKLGNVVSGVTKTSGRTKVYQATVAGLPALAAFQWAYQFGVADPTTVIDSAYRFPQHRGRTNRLQDCAKLVKTTATVLADALAEIDASSTPKAFIDSGVLYFSVVTGSDALTAEIYLDAATGLINSGTRAAAGRLDIRGLTVFGGGVDLSPFTFCEVDELRVVGSRVNALDYNALSYGTLEVCCAGSQSQFVGDGLNGHFGAVCTGSGDLYSHDNWDDGFSDHEGCTSRLTGGGLLEYNGGTGAAPAYGSDSVLRSFIGVRNQQRGTYKAGSFYVTGAPSAATPPETGADTNGLFEDCIDYESLTGFADDYTITSGAQPVTARCVRCSSIKPVTRGFNVRQAVDCSYIAGTSSSARNPATEVVTTIPLV